MLYKDTYVQNKGLAYRNALRLIPARFSKSVFHRIFERTRLRKPGSPPIKFYVRGFVRLEYPFHWRINEVCFLRGHKGD